MKKSKQFSSPKVAQFKSAIGDVNFARFQPILPILGGLTVGYSASLLLDSKVRGQVSTKFSGITGSISTGVSGISDRVSGINLTSLADTSVGGFISGWFLNLVESARGVWDSSGLLTKADASDADDVSTQADTALVTNTSAFSADQDSDNLLDDVDVGDLTGTADTNLATAPMTGTDRVSVGTDDIGAGSFGSDNYGGKRGGKVLRTSDPIITPKHVH